MKEPRSPSRWHLLSSVAMLLLGTFLLTVDLKTIQKIFEGSGDSDRAAILNIDSVFPWMNTTGITISHIQGDPTMCTDVIYTGDSRQPFGSKSDDGKGSTLVREGWKSLAHLVRTSSALKGTTCFAFFKISSPWIDQSGTELHPVWGRLPATALVMSTFPKADVFLYMDSDALLASPDNSPTKMYETLAFDGYGEDATSQHLNPGLIVNKPLTGWLCGECERFGLGHGCFNSGALLWHRAKAEVVLRAWWESRNTDKSENFVEPKSGDKFHGWNNNNAKDQLGDKMGEQNRLMYIYATNPDVHEAVWPVPRQRSVEFNSESCPNEVDEAHTPCLQNDDMHQVNWNPSEPSCFVHHYPDAKDALLQYANEVMKDEYHLRG
mmetsp:Transcript_34569/g.81500  ORF Transcript_34569/g.81500 Transcript_34569/m.81500 type:complete len:379 (+) Transcript_34569:221-1357(+)